MGYVAMIDTKEGVEKAMHDIKEVNDAAQREVLEAAKKLLD